MTASNPDSLLAGGGGNATSSGVLFESGVASYFGAAMLAERNIDRFPDMAPSAPVVVRMETEAPVDDILVETNAGGFIFIQAKTRIEFASSSDSPFAKTVEQFVRQWLVCASGSGDRHWNRPLDQARDRLVLAVGPAASNGIKTDLKRALEAKRAQGSAPLPQNQQAAFDRLTKAIDEVWRKSSASPPSEADITALTRLIDVLVFDFDGADQSLVAQVLQGIVERPSDADGAFSLLRDAFTALSARRLGVDATGLRARIAGSIRLQAPPSYRTDVARLRSYSDETRRHLEHLEETRLGAQIIKIDRKCVSAVLAAAEAGSLLLVGDPGAGKSAVMSTAASRLKQAGREVIELAVDRLPVESIEGLNHQLGLSKRILEILANWPGNEPAFLFIDALDATRGGKSEAIIRWLISEVVKMADRRWRVIASIRTFDLRMGKQFAALFAGRPPDATYLDKGFQNVRHVHIPLWNDVELQELLSLAPAINQAVKAGGTRLLDLARTPFNTRLLADLVTDGLRPDAFSEVATQSQLLELYWSYRVDRYGVAASACLSDVVHGMVETRSLQVDRIPIARQHADVLEKLLSESVLIPVVGERYIAFRHHILFDYAASKVYLDLLNPTALANVLGGDRALGLMLGPALIFALTALWENSGSGREAFWEAILVSVGRSDIDPVARSIAARVASELPTTPDDFSGFVGTLRASGDKKQLARVALNHIVGSLSVHAEDKLPVAMDAWCPLAGTLGETIDGVAWPLRTLLFILTTQEPTPEQWASIGSASRSLLRFSLNSEEQLVTQAIGFVADSYGSDPDASRQLLASLFDASRFEAHGDDDIPWLTQKLRSILASDPEFVLTIYEETFARGITDRSKTSIGNSRIMRMTSNRQQDFEMSYYNLKEFFPTFLDAEPKLATKAYVKSVHGYVLRDHPPERTETITVTLANGSQFRLREDFSYIWASNPDNRHGENALEMTQHFSAWLRDAKADEALSAAHVICTENEMGIVWARLFMVAKARADIFGSLLWPIATSHPVLWASDTRKDAIDFISAAFSDQPAAEQLAFEQRALAFEFNDAKDPARAHEYILKRLFTAIGKDCLQTEDARVLATVSEPSQARDYSNERPVHFEVTSGSPEDYWWLRRNDVDPDRPPNAALLRIAEALKAEIEVNNRTKAFPTLVGAVARLKGFTDDIARADGVDADVFSYAEGIGAEALEVIVPMFERELVKDAASVEELSRLAEQFGKSADPELGPETEARFADSPSWGSPAPRVATAHAAMQLARVGPEATARLLPLLRSLLRDPHPAVRMAVATYLNALWVTNRSAMWAMCETVVAEETNVSVLSFFVNGVLGRLVHADPERVEGFALQLKTRSVGDEGWKKLREELGSLIAILWITHKRPRAKATLEEWLGEIATNKEELDHAVSTLRGAVILGFASGKEKDIDIRHQAIGFADMVSQRTADILVPYFAQQTHSKEEDNEAIAASRILHHLLNQFYFSSGAFRDAGGSKDDAGLTSIDARRQFLEESKAVIERVASVGTPDTVHYLIDLLEFLMDANPEGVFDLSAQALLGPGRSHGYQYESLGVNRAVTLIGRFLADHRELFEDPGRRQTLVKCLDLFIEAGWPSARRLLYRLPELLQ
ncbi:ATP-binding protein [Bradyrhizobium liaoningense]|uniref:ATP-binding protein n=1 Tax=Bradyrhizobium liaoningense TaxID=43992 RepID=UPI001BAE174F|nr:ATP-binding protein [Bradyrhizobium liaoningense]MBR0840482.1 ATP-binding protein [Bradyrhizobium liaoningense]